MARTYTLDPVSAKASLPQGKQRIDVAGAYQGRMRKVFYEQKPSGSESVNIMFESDDGQEVGPLTIWTHGKEGQELYGNGLFNAILTCARVKELKSANGTVELYDFNEKAVVERQKEVYPALSDKPIGLFLREEEYQKQDGSIGTKMSISGAFEHGTKLMADEILTKQTTPVRYAGQVAWLEANPLKKLKGSNVRQSHQAETQYDDFDASGIPF